MARQPNWFSILEVILHTIQHASVESFGRREIQALFGCSQRDSIRLLHRFGATETAGALSLPRAALIVQLEAVQSGDGYSAFLRRRKKVARYLAAAQSESVSRNRSIAGSPEFLAGRSLTDLPSGVRLEPGRVQFQFAYPEDFWSMVDALADIAAHDPDAFEKAILSEDLY